MCSNYRNRFKHTNTKFVSFLLCLTNTPPTERAVASCNLETELALNFDYFLIKCAALPWWSSPEQPSSHRCCHGAFCWLSYPNTQKNNHYHNFLFLSISHFDLGIVRILSICWEKLMLSDLLQDLDLALQDVSLIREVFHELLVSAAKHSRKHTCWLLGISTKGTVKVMTSWISARENDENWQ